MTPTDIPLCIRHEADNSVAHHGLERDMLDIACQLRGLYLVGGGITHDSFNSAGRLLLGGGGGFLLDSIAVQRLPQIDILVLTENVGGVSWRGLEPEGRALLTGVLSASV